MKTNGTFGHAAQGRAVTLWGDHPDRVRLDPHFWWWRDMSKALAAIPLTTNPIVEAAARRLATAYLQHGAIPNDPVKCKAFTGLDARTMKKHWSDIKHVMVTYFSELPEGRKKLVKLKLAKANAGQAGGLATAHKKHMRDTCVAHVRAVSAEDSHFLEADTEIDIDGESKKAAFRRDHRLAQPTAEYVAKLAEQYGQSEAHIMHVWVKARARCGDDIKNPAALLRSWCAKEDWDR
jgi:hypothetical protein